MIVTMGSPNPINPELELIELAKTDPEFFGDIFELYYDRIFNYLLRRTGDAALAQDLASETFMKAMHALPRFKWRGVPLGAWLYRIANNELRMQYRKHRIVASLDELYETVGFEPVSEQDLEAELQAAQDYIDRQEQAALARRYINQLSVRYREVIVLRFAEGKKVSEIAQIVGKREGTVKSLLSRALGKLRKEMAGHDVQPKVITSIKESEGRKKK
jgi:RNA polymerase sigma-70 factor, ECF subfamily